MKRSWRLEPVVALSRPAWHKMAKQVVSVDIHEQFSKEVAAKLKDKGIHNVELETGDVMTGWQPEQAHDVLVVTGSVQSVPDHFRGWVNPSGRIFVVCGESPAMEAKLLYKTECNRVA